MFAGLSRAHTAITPGKWPRFDPTQARLEALLRRCRRGVWPRASRVRSPVSKRSARAIFGALLSVASGGCAASIPQGKQGVASLTIEGAEAMDGDAVRTCLATRERESFGFKLGGQGDPVCGEPPFDDDHIPVKLWTWPWTEWPLYDPAIFERDQERIERWYQARGYYDARVLDASVTEVEGDEVQIHVKVSEGDPVRIREIVIDVAGHGQDSLSASLKQAISLTEGARFDEYAYEQSRHALQRALGEAAFAHASVEGHVSVDPEARAADIRFDVKPGRPARFGRVFVRGQEDLAPEVIWAAAGIEAGAPFSLSALDDARQAVYALGPFAAVEVEPLVEPEAEVVHVLIKVVRGRETRFGVGAGMNSGGNFAQQEGSFAQWDVHLLARFEHRNFLGGMRRLQVEDRPRLIFDDRFPSTRDPNLGNALSLDLRQPAFIEARTSLLTSLRWDLGPDPFGGQFFRSDFNLGIGPERRFFRDALRLSSTVNWHQFRELRDIENGPYPDYDVFFMQHIAQLDLRDNPRSPTRGFYAAVGLIHAGYVLPGDFDYVRVTPDVRAYLPLPGGLVFATRARIGVMHMGASHIRIGRATDLAGLNAQGFVERLKRYGPLRHRLRGGGHNSVRGYRPNELGDAVLIGGRLDSGGLRHWETSIELRVPITQNLGTVLFVDAGDVSRTPRFRLNHPQTTLGIGLRYDTLVGPIRLDAGFAPPGLQVIGRDERARAGIGTSKVFGLAPGAVHLTIGEAF